MNARRTDATLRSADGCTLPELLGFMILMCCAIIGAHLGLHKIGGWLGLLVGGILGLFSFFFAVIALAIFSDLLNGIPRLPKCRNGCCRGPGWLFGDYGQYKSKKIGQEYVNVCKCGDCYRRRGKRFVAVSEDGKETPYLIWRPFRGWFPELPGKN